MDKRGSLVFEDVKGNAVRGKDGKERSKQMELTRAGWAGVMENVIF